MGCSEIFFSFKSLCVSSRPPQVRANNLHSMQPPHLHCKVRAVRPEVLQTVRAFRTSFCDANSSALLLPYMRFLFVGPGLCLRLPSDSISRWTPLPLANTSYCHPCSGFSPPSYCPCWAHKKRACNADTGSISERRNAPRQLSAVAVLT